MDEYRTIFVYFTTTDISSNQLLFVINAGHSDLTHAAHGEVVGVGGEETHF